MGFKMKVKEIMRLISLIAGLSAVITFVFYLAFYYKSPIIFTEPNPFIRIPEIIWGLISIPFLIYLIKDEVLKIIS